MTPALRPAAYVAWLLACLAFPGALWYYATQTPVRTTAFALSVSEPDYLANLRDPMLGCRSIALRQPEAVVIGDSHSYAAWDFATLARRAGMKLGACALGGLYAESLPSLVDVVAAGSPRARLLILGLSPRMFWESPTKAEQLASHRVLLSGLTPDPLPFVRRWLAGSALPHDGEADALAAQRARIEGLSERDIAARLGASHASIRTLRDWDRRLRDARFAPGAQASVDAACDRVRSHGLRLWVIDLPESPYLQAQYPPGVRERYLRLVRSFAACAERILVQTAVDYGLGNRHFVNRQLRADHDYARWSAPGALADDSAFDADHPNPLGARIFTRRASDRLGLGP